MIRNHTVPTLILGLTIGLLNACGSPGDPLILPGPPAEPVTIAAPQPSEPSPPLEVETRDALVMSSFGFLYPTDTEAVPALDIDHRESAAAAFEGEDGCAHDDFEGLDGEANVDHQFLRVTETYESLRIGGIADQIIGSAVKNGSMTVLVTRDTGAVGVLMGRDAPLTGNDGEVLRAGTFRPVEDAAYHANLGPPTITEQGLVAGPADVRLKMNIQIVEADLLIRDAYLWLETRPDGTVSGVLQGYWDMDGIIEILASTPAHLAALGYTLEDFQATLDAYADGAVDEEGRCHALSAAFRIEAVPAFLTTESTP